MAVALRDVVTTVDTGSAINAITVTLPTNSAGDLLLMIVCCSDETGSDLHISVSGVILGWSKLAEFASLTGGGQLCAIFAKRSSGSEGNPTIFVGNGVITSQFWAVIAESWRNDAAGNFVTVEDLLFVEDTVGPALASASLAPELNNSVLASAVFCDQSAGAPPQIGSQSASSGNTLTKDAEATGGSFTYVAAGHEDQATPVASVHTYNYTGAGTSARGAALVIFSIIIPLDPAPISQIGMFDPDSAARGWF